MQPQEAVDAPRFCIEDGTSGGALAVEDGLDAEALHALGHTPLKV